MANDDKKKSAPYVGYATLRSFLDGLKANGIPSQLDRSLLGGMSGSTQSQILGTLEYLGLKVNDRPTPLLEKLVRAEGDERRELLNTIVRANYAFLFDGDVDLEKASQKQLDDAFRAEFDQISGETLRKAASFFVSVAKDAGVQFSAYIASASPSARPAAAKRRSSSRGGGRNMDAETNDQVQEREEPLPENFIRHIFQLRKDLTVTLPLPSDLSGKDVERLHRWLQALPVDDEK